MPDKRITQLEAHDAAGFESAFVDFSACDDGYGNNVEHGDLSVQRLVEAGIRDARFPAGQREIEEAPKGYDEEPFQSRSQWRRFFAMARRGEISHAKARQWAHETKRSYKQLPERKSGGD